MKKVIVIVGATGTGKTALSVALAHSLDGEIINGDSTQVYRGMDIATAKITDQEKEGIPHHLFDICDVTDSYTVFDYQKDCRKMIDDILRRGKMPILVGGTGLYIKAALYDYEFFDEQEYSFIQYTDEELYQKLLEVDAKTEIHPHNRKRIERALTYYYNHKTPFSNKEKSDKQLYDCLWIGLRANREELYERINHRVDDMVCAGLLEEAKKFQGLDNKAIRTVIGYKELFPYFDGNISLEEAIDKIKQMSRKYAKRQDTWNHHQFSVNWFDVDYCCFENTVENVKKFIEECQ